jgi:hypothetical protein
MPSTKNWWSGEVDWSTPAGQVLKQFLSSLPGDRIFRFTLYGSAPLQLTVDRELMSADIDIFSDGEEDLRALIEAAKLGRTQSKIYLDPGYELSFRTSPRWILRAKRVQAGKVDLTIPHPLDILISKLSRLEEKDLEAFRRVQQLVGRPTAEELKEELQNAVDLFRPAFEEESPNRFGENTERLWRELFGSEIDVRKEIIEPAQARRNESFGEPRVDYKAKLKGL